MLTISKNLVWPRDLESFKGGKFNTLSLPRVGFNLLFLADLPVGIDLGQPPKNALHSWCFFYSCPAIFEVPLYLFKSSTLKATPATNVNFYLFCQEIFISESSKILFTSPLLVTGDAIYFRGIVHPLDLLEETW
jgi:hypothetical protein